MRLSVLKLVASSHDMVGVLLSLSVTRPICEDSFVVDGRICLDVDVGQTRVE
jgi:hypothetical protein